MKTYSSPASRRLHISCLILALGPFVWGYNIGVLASVLVHPGFLETLGGHDEHNASPFPRALITSVYYLGTFLSYLFLAHPVADRLGRRYAAVLGMMVTCLGQALQAGAVRPHALGMVLTGRIIAGLGIAVISTSVPLYQSEISPPKQRGRFVVMNHIGLVAGIASGFWFGYAISYWNTKLGRSAGWRCSLATSFIPGLIFLTQLPFMPESPRWLVERGESGKALAALRFYREGSHTSDEIRVELLEIERSVANFTISRLPWTALFSSSSLFARMWRAALLQFLAQLCGATAMKYSLPALFQALGIPYRIALLAGGIESTIKISFSVLEMLVIDRLGRRLTLIVGAAVMAVSLMVNAVLPLLYPNNTNKAANYVCVFFIFIYAFGYSIGFGPAAWVYGSEIFPTAVRARGLSLAASTGAAASIMATQIWPLGLAHLGSKVYIIFMTVNFACIPFIYFLYPETKGRSLENMDALFGQSGGRHGAEGSFENLLDGQDETGRPLE